MTGPISFFENQVYKPHISVLISRGVWNGSSVSQFFMKRQTMMKKTEKGENLLLQVLKEMTQGETVDCIVQGMRDRLGENALAAEEVRMYLLKPDDSGGLDVQQRALVMDQLLECVEVNFRTICDLIRYRHFKAAGLVSSVEEFLVLIHPDEAADSKEEKAT